MSASAAVEGASFGALNTSISSPLVIEATAAIPTYSGNSFTVAVPEVGTVASVTIGDTTYSPSQTPSTPQSGEFVFDSFTGELTIYLSSVVSGSLSIVGLASEYPEGVPTTDIEGGYPAFFSEWNIEGTVSISRGFKGHPSATLRFTASAENINLIRQALRNGAGVNLYGVGYLVQSSKLVELSPKKYPQRLIFVDVQLQGKWDSRGSTQRSPLDKPLKIKKLATNRKTTVGRLCSESGVGYSGPTLTIKVPADTPVSTATTARSELEKRAIVALGFPYYSSSQAVEIRRWGQTATHYLSDADVLSTELSFDLPGHAAVFEGVQLVEEFNNLVLNLDTESSDAGKNERITLYEGDPFPERPPRYADAEPGQPRIAITLRDPSMAYPGGKTKTRKKVTYLNGSTLEEEEEVYGFLFCSVDVYNVFLVPDGVAARYNPANDSYSVYEGYWEKVKQIRTVYHYRSDGYLERIERRGWEKARFKQEGSSLEAVEFKKELVQALADGDLESAARLEKIIQMYQYPGLAVPNTKGLPTSAGSQRAVYLPVEDTTEYTLEKFSKYYEDVSPSEDEEDEPEPYFCKQETRTDNSYMLAPDPESTPEDEKPPLTTGKKFQDIRAIEIVYPRPGGQQTPEIYRENTITSNAQGAGLRNVLNVSYYREMKGRPGAHTRIERDVTDDNTPFSGEDYSKYKYLLNSFDFQSGPDDPEGGSISFPGVDNPENGRRIAECELSIRNSEKTESLSVQVRHNPNYKEGDLVVWRGRCWVIFGIQDNQKIERRNGNPKIKSELFELTLGRLLKPPVNMRRVLRKEDE